MKLRYIIIWSYKNKNVFLQNKIIVNMTLKDFNITQDNRYNSLIITPLSNKLNTNLVGLPPFDFF